MNLELTKVQTEALIRELSQIVQKRPLPPQSTHCGAEGDLRAAPAGACSPGTAAPATALRAAEQGTVRTATLTCFSDWHPPYSAPEVPVIVRAFALCAALVVPFPVVAQDLHVVYFVDGNKLLAECQSEDVGGCLRYIQGVMDATNISRAISGIRPCPSEKNVVIRQLMDIVVDAMIANPVDRHRAAAVLVYNAVDDAWHCDPIKPTRR
jgi:hypothetical protein